MGIWELVIFFKEHIFLRAHDPMLSTVRTRWPELGVYIPEDKASVCKDKVFGRGRRVVSPEREREREETVDRRGFLWHTA